MNKNEALEKAIDAKIDAFFAEETVETTPAPAAAQETVEKSADVMSEIAGKPKQSSLMKDGSDAGPGQTKADEVKAAKPKDEKEGENGRPKEVSDVPNSDEDGSRAKGYEHIQSPNSKTPETSPKGTVVKSTVEISQEDFEILQKAKEAQKEEQLRKARQEQADLIKSAVKEATKDIQTENAQLKKSLEETQALVKSMAKKPQAQKSISSVQALEKSFDQGGNGQPVQKSFSKKEMLDVAEELVKSKQLTVEQAIELEDTGYIYDPSARQIFETAMRKRG